jgi:hypothetical protein
MPRASVDPTIHHKELRTVPGGYVDLRVLSFHEMEMRKDIAGRMYREVSENDDETTEEEAMRAYFEAMNVAVTTFEFRNMIVDHNLYLDDAETQKIDFRKPMHQWKLDPKVGEEISILIDGLTKIAEADLVPLHAALSSSSQEETNLPESITVT